MKKKLDDSIFDAESQVDVTAAQGGGAQVTASQLSIASTSSIQTYGVSPPIVESYSSAGPTRILFDTAGNPINVVRQGSAITAPDGGNTSFFGGGDSDGDGFPNFSGRPQRRRQPWPLSCCRPILR